MPHCGDIEHYVATWETPCSGTLCRDQRYTLSRSNFRQLCRDIKFFVATSNLFTLAKLCHSIKVLCRDTKPLVLTKLCRNIIMPCRNIESLAKAEPVATRRLQHLTSCRDRLNRDKETFVATLSRQTSKTLSRHGKLCHNLAIASSLRAMSRHRGPLSQHRTRKTMSGLGNPYHKLKPFQTCSILPGIFCTSNYFPNTINLIH